MLLLCFVTLFCLGKGVIGFVAAHGSFATLIPVAWVVGGSVVFLMWATWAGGRAKRTHRFRIAPGGLPKNAINHEVAHAEVGNRLGGHTVKGRVFPDGSGYVDVRMPCSAPIEYDVAVDMAGARGEGESFYTSPHARGDRANAAVRTAHLSPQERARVYRKAAGLSTPGLLYSGSAGALRRALETTGRYR